MTERNLEKELHFDVAHPDELQLILLGHYKHGMSTGDREFFGPDQNSDRLVLRYPNWRLMGELQYRLGMLEGRLRAYEREEDLVKIAKDAF